jgi:drug/metabolite transporter (DMT)-like permease
MTRRNANILLLLAGAVWGMGFIAQTTAMDDIGPHTFVGARFIVATMVLIPFAMWETKRSTTPLPKIAYVQFIFIGFLLFVSMALQQVGLLTTTVTNSGVLTGLYVIFVPILALGLFKQWPHFIVWPSVLLTFAGIYLLSGGSLSDLTYGDVLTILCAVATAFQVIFITRYAIKYSRPMTFSFIQFASIATFGTLIAVTTEQISVASLMGALPEILYAGIFSSALAFTIQAVAQQYTTAPQAAIFMSTEVLFAALFGALLLGERIAYTGYIGGLLIFIAMVLTETVPSMNFKKSKKIIRS